MIWSSFNTVVYWVGLRCEITSWTSRTVLAPRLHRTVRISSSASVGRGGSCRGGSLSLADIYEDVTTINFVCQPRMRQPPTCQSWLANRLTRGVNNPIALLTVFTVSLARGETLRAPSPSTLAM